ncbi:recombinase family protein [Acidaminococcus fermentans]|uniref:recombinase family protein n=1 Tax=Acidaminococcus fermentans TaxID=905 RepID=UPI001FD33F35|nr:recombinase family protein [Acidaminococcus fermentans]
MTEDGIKSSAGKTSWCAGTVRSILTNEKYKGDVLLQKRLTINFLTKKMKNNEGEVPQYYVEHNHEAIISPQVFEWVQEEIQKRKREKVRYSAQIGEFIGVLEKQGIITEFDENLWVSLLDFITIYSEKDMRITFCDGTEIQT